MPPPDEVKLGPLTSTVLDGAVWREMSQFPASQVWADEVERILCFLQARDVFDHFLPRLRAREREGALAEGRAAFFFHRHGFQILRWEPEAVPNHPGDIEIRWQQGEPVFVEVKAPGWEGELTAEEISDDRTRLPKYINAEARAIDPTERVLYSVRKALPKLAQDRANLVVAVDDLFVSPVELPKTYLSAVLAHSLESTEFARVGGVLLLNPVSHGDFVEYRKYFVPSAAAEHALPDNIRAELIAGNSDRQRPWRLRE